MPPTQPSDAPQQPLASVQALPIRPSEWTSTLVNTADEEVPPTLPRSAHHLGELEWTESPTYMRLDAYYLSMDRPHRRWLLWARHYDENWSRWGKPYVVAQGLRAGLGVEDAARLLLHDHLANQRRLGGDCFSDVNREGVLSAQDFGAIAAVVWGDSAS